MNKILSLLKNRSSIFLEESDPLLDEYKEEVKNTPYTTTSSISTMNISTKKKYFSPINNTSKYGWLNRDVYSVILSFVDGKTFCMCFSVSKSILEICNRMKKDKSTTKIISIPPRIGANMSTPYIMNICEPLPLPNFYQHSCYHHSSQLDTLDLLSLVYDRFFTKLIIATTHRNSMMKCKWIDENDYDPMTLKLGRRIYVVYYTSCGLYKPHSKKNPYLGSIISQRGKLLTDPPLTGSYYFEKDRGNRYDFNFRSNLVTLIVDNKKVRTNNLETEYIDKYAKMINSFNLSQIDK